MIFSTAAALSFLQCAVLALPASQGQVIVGGVPALPKFKYSWLVSLEQKSNSFHFCGGTLLDATTVITAAHCSVGQTASKQKVVAHRHDLKASVTSEKAAVFDVTKITVHPNYDDNTQAYDVAIWKVKLVSGDLTQTQSSLISLDTNSPVVADNSSVIVAGWGTTSSGGSASPILLETNVNILNQKACQKQYDTLAESSICAAAPGKDTCQGDSGGPLFTVGSDGKVNLIGLTSYGQGCADPSYAGVYSRVSTFVDWVKKVSLIDGE